MRYSMLAKKHPAINILILTGLLLGIMWVWSGQMAWAQTPRPTFDPTPTPTPTPEITPTPTVTAEPTPAPEGKAQAYTYTGPLLKGRVINVSTGQPQSNVPVVFVVNGISVEVASNENGEYAFENLGTANGLLNAVPARGSGLRPLTSDVAVQTRGGVETVVNLGVTTNGVGAPPLIPSVEVAPASVGANEQMTITVLVKNTLPHTISGAMVTNWLPNRLVPVTIRSSTGNPYFSGNLAIVELGTLDVNSGALVEIVAQVSGGRTAATALQGKVSFFYREDVAAQALAGANGALPTVLPVTGVGLPLVGLALLVLVMVVGWLRRRMSSASPTH
jgi:hypothetical protein